MNASSHTLPCAPRPQHPLDSILERLRALVKATRRARRRSAWMHTLQTLDDRTLRDMGLHRDEIGSVVAELTGDAPATRRRV